MQIGRMEDTGVLDANGELSVAARDAKEILDEYARSFQERNPNLYLFNAALHMDAVTPHLHLDYIPVAHGYKTKMHTRNSLTKALQEMGIEPTVSKSDTETIHWQQREREYLWRCAVSVDWKLRLSVKNAITTPYLRIRLQGKQQMN